MHAWHVSGPQVVKTNLGGVAVSVMTRLHNARLWLLLKLLAEDPYKQVRAHGGAGVDPHKGAAPQLSTVTRAAAFPESTRAT